MADVNPRLESCDGIRLWKQRVIPTAHISTETQIYLDSLSQPLRIGGKVRFPPTGNRRRKPAPLRPISLLEDKIFSRRCERIFFSDLGTQHVFVLYGSGGAGKSQTAFKFVEACQVETRYTHSFYKSVSSRTYLLSRFSDVFYVDASTKETIRPEPNRSCQRNR